MMLTCTASSVMPGWRMLVMLTCAALHVMHCAADADDAQVHGVECDALGGGC